MGDVYKRFPKGLNPESPSAQYLKYKQFYLGRAFTRKEVMAASFPSQIVKDLGISLEFFKWIRDQIGVYRK